MSIVTVVLCLILRKFDSFLNPQFWAEDSVLFYKQALEMGVASFFQPNAGYYHFVPRLIAFLCSKFDPALVPTLFNLSGVVVHCFVIGLLFSDRIFLPHKTVLALLTVFAPITPEVLVNCTNSQWVFSLCLPLLLVIQPSGSFAGKMFDWLLLTFVSLTGPFSPVFAVLFVVRAFKDQTLYSAISAVIILICAGIQSSHLNDVMVASHGDAHPAYFILNVVDFFKFVYFGTHETNTGIVSWGDTFVGMVSVTIFGLLLFCFLKKRDWSGIYLVAGVFLMVAAAVFKFRFNPALLAGGSRYFFVPTILLLWSCVCAASILRSRVLLAASLVPSLLFVFSSDFFAAPLPDLNWKFHALCLRSHQACKIPVNPVPWEADLRIPN